VKNISRSLGRAKRLNIINQKERMIEESSLKVNNKSSNRIIYACGDINESLSQKIVSDIIRLESEDPFSDIVLIVDSYGGYCDSFLSIHDMMKMSRCDISTVCLGKAMSCGQLLLMSGTKGKRFITPNSRVLMHSISNFMYGNIHELDNEMDASKRMQEDLEKLIIKYTKMNKAKVKEYMKKDSYIYAKEALDLGIVDCIINKPKDFHSKIKVK